MDKKVLIECVGKGEPKIEFIAHNFKLVMSNKNSGNVKKVRNLLIKEKKIENLFKK